MIKLFKRLILLAIVVALIFYVKGMFKKPPKMAMPPRPVETGVSIQKDVPVYLDSFGNLYSENDVDIKAQVTGEITEIKFNEGDNVKAGDLLFVIDPRPYKAALDKAQAALAADLADLQLKKDTYERNKVLFDKQLISQQDFDTYKTNYDSADAKVKLDKAEVEMEQLNYDYCFIKSPVDGVAGVRQVDLGNIVTANSGPTLVNVKTIDNLYLDFTITETHLGDIRRAMEEQKLKVQVSVENDKGGPYEGELELIDNAVDNKTGTILLRAVVPNKERPLWAGQFVRVRLILGIEQNAVLVPYEAVQMGQKGSYLFVVTSDDKAELRMVVPGSRQENYVVVKKGVQVGEKVVTVGTLGLAPGASVIDAAQLKAMQEQAAEKNKNGKNKKE